MTHVKRVCLKLKVKPINASEFVTRWDEYIKEEGVENSNIQILAGDQELLCYSRNERKPATMNFGTDY